MMKKQQQQQQQQQQLNPTFVLDPLFVESYSGIEIPFGFNGLGKIVYQRTYSRVKKDGTNEEWFETVERVVNGCFTMQLCHSKQNDGGKEEEKRTPCEIRKEAEEMYDRIFNMKFLPPGRGLWAMGTALTNTKKLYACLNNCAFVSTINLDTDPVRPFTFLMDAAMCGVGVGFDTRGARKIYVYSDSNSDLDSDSGSGSNGMSLKNFFTTIIVSIAKTGYPRIALKKNHDGNPKMYV